MPTKWNEAGRVWEEDHGLLNEAHVRQCARADVAEPRSLVPCFDRAVVSAILG